MTDRPKKLLQVDTNAKTVKGQKKGFLTGILYLAPARLSGWEVCPQRSPGCTAACLNTAGRGVFSNVQEARKRKTAFYFEDRDAFMALLFKDINALIRKANRLGLRPVVRLNGTSDIPWERVGVPTFVPEAQGEDWDGGHYVNIMSLFPGVQFYDYTKITKRALAHARGDMPANYHLTFSLTEENDADALKVLEAGGNVAAVLKEAAHYGMPPRMWLGEGGRLVSGWLDVPTIKAPVFEVVDGDATDLRHLDTKVQGMASLEHAGVIVGLKAKGKARKDNSGFVR